eukprot:17978_1
MSQDFKQTAPEYARNNPIVLATGETNKRFSYKSQKIPTKASTNYSKRCFRLVLVCTASNDVCKKDKTWATRIKYQTFLYSKHTHSARAFFHKYGDGMIRDKFWLIHRKEIEGIVKSVVLDRCYKGDDSVFQAGLYLLDNLDML